MAEAARHGLDLDKEVAAFVRKRLSREAGEAWRRENAAAIEERNAYMREHGLPFDDLRQV